MEIISIGSPERRKIKPTFGTAKVSKGIDYIDKVVGAEGSRYALKNGSVAIPATTEVSKILGLPLVHNSDYRPQELACSVFYRGINYFAGLGRLSKAERTISPDNYELELIGNGGEFWRLVAALTMHDLDLGEIRVSRGNIQNSWSGTYGTGWDYIFAPVLYGKPTGVVGAGDDRPAFSDLDFRPHIYYPAIIRAIEQATGYTISSDFFDLEIFQDSVYVCTRPATEIKQVVEEFCQASFLRIKDKNYLNGELLDWPSKTGCPYLSLSPSGDSVVVLADATLRLTLNMEGLNLDEILIAVNGVSSQSFTAADPAFINQTVEVSVQSGDAITLVVNNPSTGGSTVFFGNYLINRVYNPEVIADTDIYLATAMHPHPVRDFINAISHQFGLLWKINTIKKTIQVEPRFSYLFNGLRWDGFYKEVASEIKPLRAVNTAQHSYPDFFGDSLTLAYKQEGTFLFTVLSGTNPAFDIPVHGVRFDTGSTARGTDSANPLFTVLPTLQYSTFSTLPALLSSDYSAESTDLPEEWTSEGPITCALVYRDNATIQYDETTGTAATYNAPFLCQYLPDAVLNGQPLDKAYQVAYADGVAPGLVTIFYRQYLAIVQAPETLSINTRMTAIEFQLDDLSGLRGVQAAPTRGAFLPVAVDEFRPADGLAQFTLIKFAPITTEVVDAINHYTP